MLKTNAIISLSTQNLTILVKSDNIQAQKNDRSIQIMVLPDHPTPCHLKTHTSAAVPVVLAGTHYETNCGRSYSETDVGPQKWATAKQLLCEFLNKC